MARPPLPPEPVPRGTAATGLLAHVLASKYCDHLPLYRLEAILGRLGWPVRQPQHRLMSDRVWQSASVHADDTPVPLLAPRPT